MHPLDAHVVLDLHRDSGEVCDLTVGQRSVCGLGLLQGPLSGDGDKGFDPGLHLLYTFQQGFRKLSGRGLARSQKLVGFVNSTPDFIDQPKVVNGASNLFGEVMGTAGAHARSAVAAAALPMGVAVEIEAIFEIE